MRGWRPTDPPLWISRIWPGGGVRNMPTLCTMLLALGTSNLGVLPTYLRFYGMLWDPALPEILSPASQCVFLAPMMWAYPGHMAFGA